MKSGAFVFYIATLLPFFSFSMDGIEEIETSKKCFIEANEFLQKTKSNQFLMTDQKLIHKQQKMDLDQYEIKLQKCKESFKKMVAHFKSLEALMNAEVTAREYFQLSETDFIFHRMYELSSQKKIKQGESQGSSVCHQPSYYSLVEELMSGQSKSMDYNKGILLINLCVPLDATVLSSLVTSPMKGQARENICKYIRGKTRVKTEYNQVCTDIK